MTEKTITAWHMCWCTEKHVTPSVVFTTGLWDYRLSSLVAMATSWLHLTFEPC